MRERFLKAGSQPAPSSPETLAKLYAVWAADFARIARDRRHEHIEARRRGFAGTRDYPRWSMCALTLSDYEDELLNARHIEFDLRRAEAGALDQHLLGIARRHAAELDARHDQLAAAALIAAPDRQESSI